MKKICSLLITLLLFSLSANAQGVNQFWGMTTGGGADGLGVIFSTSATGGNFQLRKNFDYINSGSSPQYTEPVDYNGKFYGMTTRGGASDKGVIFEWDPVTNVYTKKIDFNGTNGDRPNGSLTLSGGKFYGMTLVGGSINNGVIFEWDPATNVYTKKIDFGVTNGRNPYGSLTLNAGKLYGMTSQGGTNSLGVIFEWDPATNVYTKKIDMSTANGGGPTGSLMLNGGKFYGMTSAGGSNNLGVIFEWDPATNVYTKKIDMSTANGGGPTGSLMLNGGKFYGMTSAGGTNSLGVIFEWDPATNVYTKKIDFDVTIGSNPYGSLTLSGGKFYGMTYAGGINGYLYGVGVIFEWDPATNVCTKKIDFNSQANGNNPYGNLTFSGGKFYGMTKNGGINTFNGNMCGVIFEWDPATNVYTKKIDLSDAYGRNPSGNNLTFSSGKFYGMTYEGGSNGVGVIFEWDPATNVYTKKIDFDITNGSRPTGSLTFSGGKFYGMTSGGGINSGGVIFEWDPALNVYTKKIDLIYAIGSNTGGAPSGNLTLSGGKFYGMTYGGGSNNLGVIFEWDPALNVYTKKIDFTGTNGMRPSGNDLTFNGGKFYGMTNGGGNNGLGVIFEWDPATNGYTKKIDFNGTNGSYPKGSLTLVGGKFYGEAFSNSFGVIFEWDATTNVYTKKFDFNYTNGSNPTRDLILVPAPVAKGNLVSCEVLPTVTIDATNNNTWVPIVDNLGDIAAEINANGNNLGIVSTSLYTKNGACREDFSNRLYLNRNITITPQTQPGSSVSVRLYVKKSELDSLRTALNSMGQPSGVASINEVDVFKNDDACSIVGHLTALPLTATTGTYNTDYYLQVNISSFSSFYFANKLLTEILPVKIKSFTGKRAGTVNELKWEASCYASVVFNIERSVDGIHFETIGTVTASDCNQPFYFTDNNPFAKNNYYRLRIKETGGAINYSSIILLDADNAGPLRISVKPNLVKGSSINIELNSQKAEQVELMITDVTGRKLLSRQLTAQVGINNVPINVSALASGAYWLYAVGKEGKTNVVRFVKQ